MAHYTHIALGGGGFRAVAQLGALLFLEEQGVWEKVETLAGTSAGSVVATLASCKNPSVIYRDLVAGEDFGPSRTMLDAFGFARQHIPCVRKALREATGMRNPRFDELRVATRKTLVVAATDAGTGDVRFFGGESDSVGVSVIDAVEASCSIPLLNSPRYIDGHCYVDGGIRAQMPLQAFAPDTAKSAVVGLCVDHEFPLSKKLFPRLLSAILAKTNTTEPWMYDRIAYLGTTQEILLTPPDPKTLEDLLSRGYEAMKEFYLRDSGISTEDT